MNATTAGGGGVVWKSDNAAGNRPGLRPLGIAVTSALLLFGLCATAAAQDVPLGTAGDYGVLAGSTVTNTGPTVVGGSVGVSPGSAIVGFPPGSIAPGTGVFHAADAAALQAQADLTIAYLDSAGRACSSQIAGGVLSGLTLTPGVYCMDAGSLTGTLTLNGPGVYIFKMASSLIVAPGASVVQLGGGSPCSVYWQVTSSATINTTARVLGNILALTSITLNDGASLSGRALARNGQVSLGNSQVSGCAGGSGPPVVGQPATAVPTMTTFGLLFLGMLMVVGGLFFGRRRGEQRA